MNNGFPPDKNVDGKKELFLKALKVENDSCVVEHRLIVLVVIFNYVLVFQPLEYLRWLGIMWYQRNFVELMLMGILQSGMLGAGLF